MKVLFQKSDLLKIIKIVIAGFVIVFSGYRFLNITNVSNLVFTYPGLAVLVIGSINILKGILNKEDTKIVKSIEIGIGIVAISLGLVVYLFLDNSTRSDWLIFLFIIIQGIGFVGTGFFQKRIKVFRISKIAIGVVFIIITGLFFTYNNLSLIITNSLLSINLLLIGLEIIISIIDNRRQKSKL